MTQLQTRTLIVQKQSIVDKSMHANKSGAENTTNSVVDLEEVSISSSTSSFQSTSSINQKSKTTNSSLSKTKQHQLSHPSVVGKSKPSSSKQASTSTQNLRNTSMLKKHLNILKNNGKKVLMGASASTEANKMEKDSHHEKQSSMIASIESSPKSLSSESSMLNSHHQQAESTRLAENDESTESLKSRMIAYENQIRELTSELNQTAQCKVKINDLQLEIERLSRLYDYEISKKNKYEEKLQSLKQMAEEKQIESAAIKFEFRKMQELKESLLAEKNYLKTYLNATSTYHSTLTANASSPSSNQQAASSSSTTTTIATTTNGQHMSPISIKPFQVHGSASRASATFASSVINNTNNYES